MVSIPQAVSTIAIDDENVEEGVLSNACFNTASGKYYCNLKQLQQ